ncbi:MAG TPA: polyamine aminopropyltransferase [Dehalococcoidia bacterium]|nr:polyamine aminopropyltransferase [Dehalococcoidia bacterium]
MSDPDNPDKSKWLHDEVSPALVQLHSVKQVIYSGQTEFQSIDIVDTGSFGICLVLDGKIQSSEWDEFIYHEALVHPAMLSHPHPEIVFIAGGGEGATLRQVLAHNTIRKAVMVDIDRQVIDICHRFLSSLHQGSFDDPRAEIHFADARRYLQETNDGFDVIIIDLVEPLEAGPACLLYTQEFYQLVKERLNPDGIVSVQSGASGWTNLENFTAIINTLKSVFSIVCPYQVYVPSFVDQWGFATASQSLTPAKLSPKEIDHRILTRLFKKLKSYDGVSHQALFTLPKHLRHQLAITKRIITDKKPIFTY